MCPAVNLSCCPGLLPCVLRGEQQTRWRVILINTLIGCYGVTVRLLVIFSKRRQLHVQPCSVYLFDHLVSLCPFCKSGFFMSFHVIEHFVSIDVSLVVQFTAMIMWLIITFSDCSRRLMWAAWLVGQVSTRPTHSELKWVFFPCYSDILSVYPSVWSSIHLTILPFVCLSDCLSIRLSVCLVCLSTSLSCLPVCLVCLPACLSFFLSLCAYHV